MAHSTHGTLAHRHTLASDWSQPALARTWRTLSMLLATLGVISATLHWSIPAAVFCLMGLWAHAKRQAHEG